MVPTMLGGQNGITQIFFSQPEPKRITILSEDVKFLSVPGIQSCIATKASMILPPGPGLLPTQS